MQCAREHHLSLPAGRPGGLRGRLARGSRTTTTRDGLSSRRTSQAGLSAPSALRWFRTPGAAWRRQNGWPWIGQHVQPLAVHVVGSSRSTPSSDREDRVPRTAHSSRVARTRDPIPAWIVAHLAPAWTFDAAMITEVGSTDPTWLWTGSAASARRADLTQAGTFASAVTHARAAAWRQHGAHEAGTCGRTDDGPLPQVGELVRAGEIMEVRGPTAPRRTPSGSHSRTRSGSILETLTR